jgi:hypothetical protein
MLAILKVSWFNCFTVSFPGFVRNLRSCLDLDFYTSFFKIIEILFGSIRANQERRGIASFLIILIEYNSTNIYR